MKKTQLRIALALACCYSLSTQATPYMIHSNLDIDTVYGTDSYSASVNYSGLFDLASILGTSNFFTDYLVNSASIFFQWTDDLDDPTTKTSESEHTTSYTSYSVYSGSYSSPTVYLNRDATTSWDENYVTEREGADLFIDGQLVGSSSTLSSTTTSTETLLVGSQLDGTSSYSYGGYRVCGGWGGSCTTYYYWGVAYRETTFYDEITKSTTNYTGDFSIATELSGSVLDNFKQTGILPFVFTMHGDAKLVGARLFAEVEKVPPVVISQLPVPVPEPATLALLGLGLAGLGVVRRRKT